MADPISSRDNKKLKLFSAAAAGRGRKKYGVFPVEGRRMVAEAAEFAPRRVKYILSSETFAVSNPDFIRSLDENGFMVYTVVDKLFNEASSTSTPQGIAALVETAAETERGEITKALVLDGVSEPGNVGAIIRAAEAAGVQAVYMTAGCADVYNPKSVRSTMGSIFRMRLVRGCGADELRAMKENGFFIAASALDGSVDLYDFIGSDVCRKSEKLAVVIGSEARGVSDKVLALSDVRVRIPMSGRVESLNAAVAAGILMYSIFRQAEV